MLKQKVQFRSASEKTYPFLVHSINAKFRNIGAVYVLTKRTKDAELKNYHSVIYIGQTDALKDAIEKHKDAKWPREYGCNSVCVHPEKDEELRSQILADMRRFYIPYIDVEADNPCAKKNTGQKKFHNHAVSKHKAGQHGPALC